jgi:uncharacterized membrane protein
MNINSLSAILGMAAATYLTRALGFYVAGKFRMTPQFRAALDAVPAAILVSIIGPMLAKGTFAEILSAIVVLTLAFRKVNLIFCLIAGVIAVNSFRYLI